LGFNWNHFVLQPYILFLIKVLLRYWVICVFASWNSLITGNIIPLIFSFTFTCEWNFFIIFLSMLFLVFFRAFYIANINMVLIYFINWISLIYSYLRHDVESVELGLLPSIWWLSTTLKSRRIIDLSKFSIIKYSFSSFFFTRIFRNNVAFVIRNILCKFLILITSHWIVNRIMRLIMFYSWHLVRNLVILTINIHNIVLIMLIHSITIIWVIPTIQIIISFVINNADLLTVLIYVIIQFFKRFLTVIYHFYCILTQFRLGFLAYLRIRRFVEIPFVGFSVS